MTTSTDATSKTFDLKFPFTARGGQTYTSFTARDPKVRDIKKFMKLAPEDETGAIQAVMADLCEVSPDIIGEVHVRDFFTMKNWFVSFFEDDAADA